MPLRIVQSSTRRGTEDYWDWEVHLEGADAELDQIEYVEYTLHETFPNPVRRIYERNSRFQLKTRGWGTFTLYVRIHHKDVKRRDDQHDFNLRFDVPSTELALQ